MKLFLGSGNFQALHLATLIFHGIDSLISSLPFPRVDGTRFICLLFLCIIIFPPSLGSFPRNHINYIFLLQNYKIIPSPKLQQILSNLTHLGRGLSLNSQLGFYYIFTYLHDQELITRGITFPYPLKRHQPLHDLEDIAKMDTSP